MSFALMPILLAGLTLAAHAVARARALRLAGGDARGLAALPGFYGLSAAHAVAVPALADALKDRGLLETTFNPGLLPLPDASDRRHDAAGGPASAPILGGLVPTLKTLPGSIVSTRASSDQIKIEARGVQVHYGTTHAIEEVDVDILDKTVTVFIGPSGCGNSTFLRCLNRMNDTIDTCCVEGSIRMDGEDICDKRVDPVLLRARVGMVFQKPNPAPKSNCDNVAYGPKIHGPTRNKTGLDQIDETSLRKTALWNEMEDGLTAPGSGLSGRPAAAPLHRAGHRNQPRGSVDGRILFGAGSHRHCPGRRADRRIARAVFGGDRHPYNAAGRAGQPAEGLFHLCHLVEYGETGQIFTQPRDPRTESCIT